MNIRGHLRKLLDSLSERPGDPATVATLTTGDREHLNQLVAQTSLRELFEKYDGLERDGLMDLLGRDRVDELTLPNVARLVHGIQSVRVTPGSAELLTELLLGRTASELTRLKNLINTAEDHQDLEDLVFSDLSPTQRKAVLDHFESAAAQVRIEDSKILCDIDDTVFCTVNDRRWPRGILYPGVLGLLDALELGQHEAPFDRGNLTFVTARPSDAWGLVENYSRQALRRAGVSQMAVLSGSLFSLASNEAMAARKVENIDRYRRLFPEYRIIFLGDSGQGDVQVGEKLFEQHPEALRLVLIHDVAGTPADIRAEYAERGIFFHDTYVGAAIVAHGHGLISDGGLARVVREARTAFSDVVWENTQQRETMDELMARDLARVG